MTTVLELVAGSLVFGWLLSMLPYIGNKLWVGYALAGATIGVSAALGFYFGGIWIATFEPFGVMLPALCLISSLRRRNLIRFATITAWEKLGWAAVTALVIAGTGGEFDYNLYSLFYTGWEPFAAASLIALWAWWRRQDHVLAAVFIGQVFWLMDIGSSNLYDHLTHALLVPGLTVSALLQLFRERRQRRSPINES
jgi:hypothetical protein